MSLHRGSHGLAHNLDRFDFYSDFELVAAEAVRLSVAPETIRFYRDHYGDEPVIVVLKGQVLQIPAYEFHIRKWMLGERIHLIQQVINAAA